MRDVIYERYTMNMLDMYSREKANKIHLDKMNRDANNRRLLTSSNKFRDQENAHPKRWLRFAITFAVVLIGLSVIAMRLI